MSDAVLESTIKAVRQALGDSGRDQRLIQTVYGQGYRFLAAVEARPEPDLMAEDMAPPLPDAPGEEHPLVPAVCAVLSAERATQEAISVFLPLVSEAERRQLTVMFCQLMADRPLARPLDPDVLYAIIRTYQETCAGIIRQFAGHMAQSRGEELVVYFGYPQAHDDDPKRAVQAGLRLVEALREYPPRLPHVPGTHWAVRVGVHTGLVVLGPLGDAGSDDRWALGDTPTLAARLQGLATPNTVVISAATQRLIQGYFVCHPLAVHSVDGVATPLQAYRVVRESTAQHRLDVMPPSGLTPFVGREHERGLLSACWEQVQEGSGRVALIQGEAGIGKSRLVRVLQAQCAAAPHTEIVWHGSPAHQHSPLHPVLTHLRRLVGGRPAEDPTAILQRLEAVLVPSGVPMPEVVPLVAAFLALPLPEGYPPLRLTPQRQRQKTLEALLVWLLAEASRQPVLCIVEDLHWLDLSTLEFLSLLIDQVPTTRLLLVLTCRLEFHPPWGFRASLTPITLGRLSPSQATMMVQRVARQALALAEELGMRPLQAHCHRDLGRLYGQTGREEQARTALLTAIDLYRAMAMTFWLPQAEAALAQVV